LGTKGATMAAIDAVRGGKDEAGKDKRGKGMTDEDPIAKLFAAHTDGAAVAVGVETARLPKGLAEDIPPNMRLERGIAVLDAKGITLRAEGTKEQVDTVSGAIKGGLTLMVSAAEAQRKDLVDKGGDTFEGAFAIVTAHSAKRAQTLLEPKIDDTSLTIEIPFSMGDPASLASMAGIAAAIAVPAFTKYMRRSKTSEARVQIAKMFDAASAYFNEEHVARGSVALGAGGELAAIAAHGCPNDGNRKGESGITPPLSVDCNEGPGGRCVPSAGGGGGPGSYDSALWTDNEVWNGLNFQQEQAHYFHYNFIWENDNAGFGACQFTAQAFGDLDGDGIFSTFERAGAADENGLNAAAGLYIDQEVE
jgi:type IV pilus assembly protein PilA